MVAVRYNQRNSFTFPTSRGDVTFYPGVNLNVDPDIWKEIRQHPIAKILLEQNLLEPLKSEPDPTLEIEGIPVVDRPDEPVPAMPIQDRSAAKTKKPKES